MGSILPPSSTATERALELSLARPEALPVDAASLWTPETCPASFLPWLAHSLSVDDWDAGWSEQTQRDVIAASVEIHRRKGTVWAIKAAMAAMGYGDATIIEGWQTMVGGPWVVCNDPAPARDFVAGGGLLAVEIDRASDGWCFDATGALITVGPGQMRVDHDPVTLTRRGLLVEAAATNAVANSADFGSAYWTKQSGCVVTSDAALAPDGSMTADQVDLGISQWSAVYRNAAIGVGTHTLSVWVRTNGSPVPFQMSAYNATNGDLRSPIFTATEVWQRFSHTFTAAATTNVYPVIQKAGGAAACTVLLWGAQVETGAVATSYIPTTAAPVTRAAEQLVLPAKLGARDLTIVTAARTVDLASADMSGDLRPALVSPALVQRIETGPASGPVPIDMEVGGAGHWAE